MYFNNHKLAKNSFVTFSNSYRVEVSSPSYYAHDQAIGVLVKHFYNSKHIPLLTTWPYLPKGNVTHTELYDTKYSSLFITTSDNPLEDASQIQKNKYPFLHYNSGHFFSPTYKLANVLFQILLNYVLYREKNAGVNLQRCLNTSFRKSSQVVQIKTEIHFLLT